MRATPRLALVATLALGCSGGVDPSDGGPDTCGNGIREPGERCDDGNTIDDDCCNNTCTVGSCLVPQTHATIQEGVDDGACPTVWVMPGTYAENVSVGRDVRIEAVGDGEVVVDGSARGSVIRITGAHAVTLRGLSLTNGYAEAGAGIRNDGGALTVIGGRVAGNLAEGDAAQGAGIWSEGGSIALDGAAIEDNEALGTGRAAEGGGLRMRGGAVTLVGARVAGNRVTVASATASSGRGGGVALDDATLELGDGSELADNVVEVTATAPGARAVGGGVSLLGEGSIALAGDSVVTGNEARVTGPNAQAVGGGIAGPAPTVRVEGSAVIDNLARAEATDAQRTDAHGGGISLLTGGDVELVDARVEGNVAEATGPAELYALGGGIAADGAAVAIDASRVSGNEARVVGAGALDASSAFGGGIHTFHQSGTPQPITLLDSELSENRATVEGVGSAAGAGIFANAAAATSRVAVRLERSTAAGNLSRAGALARGGALTAYANVPDAQVELVVVASTLSGNRAEATAADGIGSGGAVALVARDAAATGALHLSSSTVAANGASGAGLALGGGVESEGASVESSCTVTARNTILAANTATGGPDCAVARTRLLTDGYNLLGDPDRCAFEGDTSTHVVGMDPELAALAAGDGETPTHAIAATSPAIDAGDPSGCADHEGAAIETDQRGLPRDAGGRCDLGAYERQ